MAILGVLTLSSAVYLYGLGHRVQGASYAGIRPINASDYNQHLSFIDQCRRGHFLLQNEFTSAAHRGYLVRPVYFLLSFPFRAVSWSDSVVFHVMRVVIGLIMLIALRRLFAGWGLDRETAWWAFLLVALASGFGYLLRRAVPGSPDTQVPEMVLFLSLGEAPHFIYSLLFLWLGLYWYYRSAGELEAIQVRYMAGYFGALALLWWEHPFEAVILAGVGVSSLWLFRSWKAIAVVVGGIALVSLPPFLYYEHLKALPAFSGWGSAQNLMPSPAPLALLPALAPLAAVAVPGHLVMRKEAATRRLSAFLAAWFLAQLVLAYLPFPFGRRLLAGICLPLCVPAAFTLRRYFPGWLAATLIACLSLTNLFMTRDMIREVASGRMPYYLPGPYSAAFQWLRDQPDRSPVISGFVTGNFIPPYTQHASFMGHSSFTPDIAGKKAAALQFYRNPGAAFLKANNIGYVFWGREERAMAGNAFQWPFPPVYDHEGIQIFKLSEMRARAKF